MKQAGLWGVKGGQWSEDKGKKETFWSALWNSGTGQSFLMS